jgi:protein-tyrosine-phosphatase
MSNGGNHRLNRIEEILEEAVQLTRSNARAIQSLTDDLAEFKLIVAIDRSQAREERQELRQAMIGIANLLSSLDSDRPTILRKLNTIENKVDQLLERGNDDQAQS